MMYVLWNRCPIFYLLSLCPCPLSCRHRLVAASSESIYPCIQNRTWWGHDTHAYDHDWCMEWSRRSPTRVSKSTRRSKVDPVRVPKVEAKSNSSSSPVRTPGAVRNKTDAQVAYGVGFERSIYGWKQNFIKIPMALVSCPNSSWINGNLRNKLTSRICQGASKCIQQVIPSSNFSPLLAMHESS
jgi:hypothetical protein